jgi:hypothetical protein
MMAGLSNGSLHLGTADHAREGADISMAIVENGPMQPPSRFVAFLTFALR